MFSILHLNGIVSRSEHMAKKKSGSESDVTDATPYCEEIYHPRQHLYLREQFGTKKEIENYGKKY